MPEGTETDGLKVKSYFESQMPLVSGRWRRIFPVDWTPPREEVSWQRKQVYEDSPGRTRKKVGDEEEEETKEKGALQHHTNPGNNAPWGEAAILT